MKNPRPIETQHLGDGVYLNCDQNPGHIGLTTGHHLASQANDVVWLDFEVELALLNLLLHRNGLEAHQTEIATATENDIG